MTGLNDFLVQAFVKEAGINMVRVPYRDAVQAATDLGENRIQAYSSAYAIALGPSAGKELLKIERRTRPQRQPLTVQRETCLDPFRDGSVVDADLCGDVDKSFPRGSQQLNLVK